MRKYRGAIERRRKRRKGILRTRQEKNRANYKTAKKEAKDGGSGDSKSVRPAP